MFDLKKNIYLCAKCGLGFVTQDGEPEITTPFIVNCINDECGGDARSCFYMAPQDFLKQFPPAIIWRRDDESGQVEGVPPEKNNTKSN